MDRDSIQGTVATHGHPTRSSDHADPTWSTNHDVDNDANRTASSPVRPDMRRYQQIQSPRITCSDVPTTGMIRYDTIQDQTFSSTFRDTIRDMLPVDDVRRRDEFWGSLRREPTHGIIPDSLSASHRAGRERMIKWNDCTDGGYDSSDDASASAPPNQSLQERGRSRIPRRSRRTAPSTPRRRYDSASTDDGAPVRRPHHRIRPQTFDGKGSFETFWAHFQNCATYNKWNDADQLAHLKASLTATHLRIRSAS